jgi:hypothetical protein
MSKYEQKQKAKEDNVKNTDVSCIGRTLLAVAYWSTGCTEGPCLHLQRWGKFKAEERTVADKHEAFRQTLNAVRTGHSSGGHRARQQSLTAPHACGVGQQRTENKISARHCQEQIESKYCPPNCRFKSRERTYQDGRQV